MIFLSSSLIHIAFGILLQILIEVKSQTTIFNPDLRKGHTVTFIDDKLYILGGAIPSVDTKSPKEKFLFLDFSASFSTSGLKWVDLSTNDNIPPHRFASSVKGGENNSTLFLYGGVSLNGEPMDLVYAFNTQNNLWNIPEITGTQPTATIGITTVIDYNGLIYIFSGASTVVTNDMFILDSKHLSWKRASSVNAPSPRTQYGAVFLPNKNIIYMGGFHPDTDRFTLNEVYVYDTTNDIWNVKTTNGLIPSPRSSFSSVLGLDGQKVIIFGGFGSNNTNLNPESSLYVLDTNNFNWYTPKVTGKIPSSRAFHKSVLIGKYMVTTFGEGYTQGVENDILLLDISNNDEYIWTSSFTVSPPSNHTGILVGSVIGTLIGVSLLTIGGFFLYKRYKKEAIPTPSDEEILQIPKETYHQGQQETPPSQIQQIYNNGRENNTIYNNGQENNPIDNHGQENNPIYNDGQKNDPIYNHGQENGPTDNHGQENDPIYNHGQKNDPSKYKNQFNNDDNKF